MPETASASGLFISVFSRSGLCRGGPRGKRGRIVELQKKISRIKTLPLLPMRGMVVFPSQAAPFDVSRRKSIQAVGLAMERDQLIFLAAQKNREDEEPEETQIEPVGVVARIRQILRLSGESFRIMVEGLYRARVKEYIQTEPFYETVVRECRESRLTDPLIREALVRECREAFERYTRINAGGIPEISLHVSAEKEPGRLADYIAANLPLQPEDKQKILSVIPVERRAETLLTLLEREIDILSVERSIEQRVQEQVEKNQKEYYLREQIRAIYHELGDTDNPQEEADTYRERIRALSLGGEEEESLLRECDRLYKLPSGSHEAAVIRGYLDLCLELPWHQRTTDKLDLAKAQKVMDRDHYGLDKIKERILEILSVRKLVPDIRGQVICLVGPPGVGKTSVARSIAEAMGRKFVRVSLGGVRDEADIRGHRKTYIGAMPGRIINAVRRAGVKNPVILLDEIDKMGNDFRGDPASAMLEVLDTEQNDTFRDHYVELPFDLSEVMFITSANNAELIPAPLYDRMDPIFLSSYTAEDKLHIAMDHLLPRQLKRHGLSRRQLSLSEETVREMIAGYTKEAGVRGLERLIARLLRQAAKKIATGEVRRVTVGPADLETCLGPRKYKGEQLLARDEVGVVNGLAWTAVGGETMPVEVAVLDGTGKLELTGSLGDVMKESARTAISYVRSRAAEWRIDNDFYKNKDIHIHVPEGAVPKDGPSAGVTIATAILSALTGTPVRRDVAMTGEITLRGRVLPIGGLKEKTMAAYCRGMKTVVIPEDNEPDLAEIDPLVRRELQFVPARHLDKVLEAALVQSPEGQPVAGPVL